MYPEDLPNCGCPDPVTPIPTAPAPPACLGGEPCAEVINTTCVRYDGADIPGIGDGGDNITGIVQNLAYRSILEFVYVNTSITLLPSHVGKAIMIDTVTNGIDVTITIPNFTDAQFPVGGQVTFFFDQRFEFTNALFATGGSTLKVKNNCDRLDGLYSKAVLVKQFHDVGDNETTWYLSGELND